MTPESDTAPTNATSPLENRQAAQSPGKAKIPLPYKLYGLYCFVTATVSLALVAVVVTLSALGRVSLTAGSHNSTLTLVLSIVEFVFAGAQYLTMIAFGMALLRNHRRHAAQFAYAFIAVNIVLLVIEIMLHGIGSNLIANFVQLGILIVISVTVDPTLHEERRRERAAHDAELETAAKEGTLGRAKGDRGFIELDFFNLFWVFAVCCVLGLCIETVYHFVIAAPGEYQDRAGLLFGPFSPIYGFGAVLMTVALNRFYQSNILVIFAVSAVIGGLFEAATAWFMKTAFGAVAWNYSDATILGLFPDPVAALFGGTTCTLFICMWGALGCIWIKFCLPWLLKLINLIPWRARYGVTAVCAALMLANGIMTLEALDCWYERLSGVQPTTPIEWFCAEHFDNAFMQHRFQTMTITPEDTARTGSS